MSTPFVTPALKALSVLLLYPEETLPPSIPDIAAVLETRAALSAPARAALAPLLRDLAHGDLYELQEGYVDLFDKTRKLSLHLFEHVHGESRDRGQAMVDLGQLYGSGGLQISSRELPDYLPMFLEYLATRPLDEALTQLANTGHILAELRKRLARRNSAYAAVFTALLSMIGQAELPDAEADADVASEDSLAALDAAWEETAVTFGMQPASAGCPSRQPGGRPCHQAGSSQPAGR